jgi:hypothetical protein
MLVSHKPSCGTFSSSGEKGWDRFFADVPWPDDVEVIAFDFKEIDPEDPYTDLDFFLDQAGEILNALDSGPLGLPCTSEKNPARTFLRRGRVSRLCGKCARRLFLDSQRHTLNWDSLGELM